MIGLVAKVKGPSGSRDIFIPWERVKGLNTKGAELSSPAMNLRRFHGARVRWCCARASSTAVVDLEGRRVVRVNDLDRRDADGSWALVAVDVGPSALLRRAGVRRLGQRVGKPALISWRR